MDQSFEGKWGRFRVPFRAPLVLSVLMVWLAVGSLGLEGCGYFVKPRGTPLSVQDVAPDFSLQAVSGERVSLRSLLRQGPVLLIFYRGHW